MADAQPSLNGLKEQAWLTQTEPKIKHFLWRVLSSAIHVMEALSKRGMKVDERCQYCGTEPETANHVLFTCHVARQTWARSLFPLPQNGFSEVSVFTNLHYLFQMSKNIQIPLQIRRVFPWVLWSLWKNRNKFFFEGKEFDGETSIAKIQQEAEVWFLAQSLDHQEEKKEEP